MIIIKRLSIALLFLGFLPMQIFGDTGVDKSEPAGLLLTWQQDPTTTMMIDWHAEPENNRELKSTLLYRKIGSDSWQELMAAELDYPFSERKLFRIELTNLEPGTEYQFRAGDFDRLYRFKTMPENLEEPLVFAAGGDILDRGAEQRQEWMTRMNNVAMEYNPEFILWGGDLAYADGLEDQIWRWHMFFETNMNTLITDEGRVIPIVVAIGNHEVRGGSIYSHDDYEQTDEFRQQISPYFFSLFAFPGQPGYGVLDFGNYLSIPILDTNHANPMEGEQTEWLDRVLAERQEVPHVLPVYHVPGFPAHRNYDGRSNALVRELWSPLFEKHGVRVVFENHDHAFKRTYPIRNGQIDYLKGITYIGDGPWGGGIRDGDNRGAWYNHKVTDIRNAIIVTLQGNHQHFMTVSEYGEIIDEYPETPHSVQYEAIQRTLNRFHTIPID